MLLVTYFLKCSIIAYSISLRYLEYLEVRPSKHTQTQHSYIRRLEYLEIRPSKNTNATIIGCGSVQIPKKRELSQRHSLPIKHTNTHIDKQIEKSRSGNCLHHPIEYIQTYIQTYIWYILKAILREILFFSRVYFRLCTFYDNIGHLSACTWILLVAVGDNGEHPQSSNHIFKLYNT